MSTPAPLSRFPNFPINPKTVHFTVHANVYINRYTPTPPLSPVYVVIDVEKEHEARGWQVKRKRVDLVRAAEVGVNRKKRTKADVITGFTSIYSHSSDRF